MLKIILLIIALMTNPSKVIAYNEIRLHSNNKNITKKLDKLNDNYTYKQKRRVELPNGEVFYKYQQYYKGVKVWGGSMVTKETKDVKE